VSSCTEGCVGSVNKKLIIIQVGSVNNTIIMIQVGSVNNTIINNNSSTEGKLAAVPPDSSCTPPIASSMTPPDTSKDPS
jgi:hypothetical protein